MGVGACAWKLTPDVPNMAKSVPRTETTHEDFPMKRILIIGIGAGNPDYITMQAVKALNRTDVFFLMDKGQSKDKLIDLRREICDTYIT